MKDLFAAFGSEFFQPMMTLFAPGAVAVCSWFVGWIQRSNMMAELVSRNHTESAFLLVLTGFVVGLLLENLGSLIEGEYFDKRLPHKERKYQHHIEEWFLYLRQAFAVEPVGHRYLRRLVTHMKFELGMGLALPVFGAGLFFTRLSAIPAILAAIVSVSSGAYLVLYEARRSHESLSDVRRELLKGIAVIQ
jgi:hypothetical protein